MSVASVAVAVFPVACPSVCLVGVVQLSRAQKAHFIEWAQEQAQAQAQAQFASLSRSLYANIWSLAPSHSFMSQGHVRGRLPDWPKSLQVLLSRCQMQKAQ